MMGKLARKNEKGFIFTVDAIFATLIAASAITILLAAFYVSPFSYQPSVTESASLTSALLQTSVAQAASGSAYASYSASRTGSLSYPWPAYGNNASLSSSSAMPGPSVPLMQFKYQVPSSYILPLVAVADGIVVFATPSTLFALNATTGAPVFSTYTGNVFTGAPLIYNHMIYTSNTAGYVNAYTEAGTQIWSASVSGTSGMILEGQGGLLSANMILMYPTNGTSFASAPIIAPSAFANGQYVSTFYTGSAPEVRTYSASSGVINNPWYNTESGGSSYVSPVAEAGNLIVFGSGDNVYATAPGSTTLWTATLNNAVEGGPAIYNGTVYVQTVNAIYAYSQAGSQLFRTATPTNNYYITPSATATTLYVLTNGNTFAAYNTTNGAQRWTVTLSGGGGTILNYFAGDIALAYGNAYFAVGNVLYSFGSCPAYGHSSLLTAMSSMYMSGKAGCADMLFNSAYNSSNAGVFIDGKYGPAQSMASFDGSSSRIHVNLHSWTPNAITIAAWVNVAGGTNSWDAVINTTTVMFSANLNGLYFWPDTNNFVMSYGTSSLSGKWSFIAANWSYVNETGTFFIDGKPVETQSNTQPAERAMSTALIGEYSNQYFDGSMANLQVYDTALSAKEITALYNEGITGGPVNSSSIVAWWPLLGDANDYANFQDGEAYGVSYSPGTFLPSPFTNAAFVSKVGVPLSINESGTYSLHNVGVAVWR